MEKSLSKLIKTVFLSAMMMLLPFTAEAASSITVHDQNGMYYKLNTNAKTAMITRPSNGYYSGSVSFASYITYKDVTYKVTSTDDYAFCKYDINARANDDIISVTLPNTLTNIGYGTFYCCRKLESVYIPESVTSIDAIAFQNCSSLTSVVLPEGLKSMGYQAFYQCTGLKSVTIPSTLSAISQEAFYGCSGLTSLVLPEGVKKIVRDAFWGCSGLTSISLPESLTDIGIRAFFGCSGLKSLTIPSGVNTLESYAFNLCTSLTSVTMKASPTNLSCTFSNNVKEITFDCDSVTPISSDSIERVILTDKVKVIGDEAFKQRTRLKWENIHFGKGLKGIGFRAFYECDSIKNAVLPEGVEWLSRCFESCDYLESVTLPKSLKGCYSPFIYSNKLSAIHISDLAAWCALELDNGLLKNITCLYLNGEKIVNMVIPDGVPSIGDYAFNNMFQLETLTIPRSVTAIGDRAFRGCTNLKSVHCYANEIPETGEESFSYIGTTYRSRPYEATLYVHQSVRSLYASTEPWSNFKTIVGINDNAPTKCAKPTISYADGRLKFKSATEGVTFVSEIWPVDENGNIGDGEPKDYSTSRISLEPRYKVTVYCKAEACEDSEKTTAIMDWNNGNPKITYIR